MQDYGNMTIRDLARECQTVEDVQTMLKNLFKETPQHVFEAEIEDHLATPNTMPIPSHSSIPINKYSLNISVSFQ